MMPWFEAGFLIMWQMVNALCIGIISLLFWLNRFPQPPQTGNVPGQKTGNQTNRRQTDDETAKASVKLWEGFAFAGPVWITLDSPPFYSSTLACPR